MKLHLLDLGAANQATVTLGDRTFGGAAGSVAALCDTFTFQLQSLNVARGDRRMTIRPDDCFAQVVDGHLHVTVLSDKDVKWTSNLNVAAVTSVELNTSSSTVAGGAVASFLSNIHMPSAAIGLVAGLLLKG